jgi:hypothetical protein
MIAYFTDLNRTKVGRLGINKGKKGGRAACLSSVDDDDWRFLKQSEYTYLKPVVLQLTKGNHLSISYLASSVWSSASSCFKVLISSSRHLTR